MPLVTKGTILQVSYICTHTHTSTLERLQSGLLTALRTITYIGADSKQLSQLVILVLKKKKITAQWQKGVGKDNKDTIVHCSMI